MNTQLFPGIPFSPQAVLTNNLGAADTVIEVSDISAFPPAPNLATIGTDEEGETILYAAKTATALSGCVRGVEGTAKTWAKGEAIGRNWTAKDHADLIATVKSAAETALDAQVEGKEHQKDANAHKELFSTKQDTLTGVPGQVVGFNADGAAVAVQGWSNQNLLRNWDFRNPVNRNGQATYTNKKYTIDGWANLIDGMTTSLTEDGLHLTSSNNLNFAQICMGIEEAKKRYKGLTLTLSFLLSTGLTSVSYTFIGNETSLDVTGNVVSNAEADMWFDLRNSLFVCCLYAPVPSDVYLIAAKLELGDHQTLARQNDDGEWEIIDPPDYDLQYALCSLYSPITGEWVGNQHSNYALLDNAYWASSDAIIDQRRGMIVPSGTEYFTPSTSEWSRVGYTDKYYKVDGVLTNGITNLITINSVQYMVHAEDCVRGYTGDSYGIDRWRAHMANVELNANGLKMTTTAAFGRIIQDIDRPGLTNQALTFSVLYSGLSLGGVRLYYGPGDHLLAKSSETSGLISGTFIFPADATGAVNVFIALESKDASVNLIASGLDYGPVQTLAHQDADGNWVLNDPPPDKALELLRCQRYAINLTDGAVAYESLAVGFASVSNPQVIKVLMPLPTKMRARPTPVVIGDIADFQLYNSETNWASVANIAVEGVYPSAVALTVSASKPLTINTPYTLRLINADTALLLSADL